jgi:hypothetical protein
MDDSRCAINESRNEIDDCRSVVIDDCRSVVIDDSRSVVINDSSSVVIDDSRSVASEVALRTLVINLLARKLYNISWLNDQFQNLNGCVGLAHKY